MPIQSQSIIVGGGVELLAPATIGHIALISSLGPPGTISDSIMRQFTDGAVDAVTIGVPDVAAGLGATETMRLSEGFISEDGLNASPDSFIAGRGASATTGSNQVAIGLNAAAIFDDSVAIGNGATAQFGPLAAQGSVAIGSFSTSVEGGVAIGINAFASNAAGAADEGDAVAIGNSSYAEGYGVSIGFQSSGEMDGLAFGQASYAEEQAVTIGAGAYGELEGVVAGYQAYSGTQGAAFGYQASASGECVAIGYRSRAGDFGPTLGCVAVGWQAEALGSQQIVIGVNITGNDPAVLLDNIAIIGGWDCDIETMLIGRGDVVAGPAARLIRFTNGDGVDDAAGDLTIQAPLGTGNAASADINLDVGTPGASGAAVQAALTAVRASFTSVAGETGLVIHDVNTGIMQRVLVGAAGTGPGGVGRALYLA